MTSSACSSAGPGRGRITVNEMTQIKTSVLRERSRPVCSSHILAPGQTTDRPTLVRSAEVNEQQTCLRLTSTSLLFTACHALFRLAVSSTAPGYGPEPPLTNVQNDPSPKSPLNCSGISMGIPSEPLSAALKPSSDIARARSLYARSATGRKGVASKA